jgi:hypothetical protein
LKQAGRFRECRPILPNLVPAVKHTQAKDRFHRNYLQCKASGEQKRHEGKTKAAKKVEMDAKKNTLRAEDISKGVFVLVSNLPKKEPRIAEKEKAALPMVANQ